MRIATILASSAFLASAGMAQAQTTSDPSVPRAAHAGPAHPPHVGTTQTKAIDDMDRVIEQEQKRIDRVMNICPRC